MSKVLKRSLDLLFALAKTDTSMAVGKLAASVDIPVSTVYRLVQELERRGLVRYCEEGNISLGPTLVELGRAARSQMAADLPSIAMPYMLQLSKSTEETTILTIPSTFGAVCVEVVNSPRPIRLSFEKWRVLPFHAGASAITLLAFMDEAIIQRVLVSSPESHYANGEPVDPHTLEQTLKESRQRGYTVTCGEVDPGATGIGAPIFSEKGAILAALTLAGPSNRFEGGRLKELVAQVKQTAREIQEHVHGISL